MSNSSTTSEPALIEPIHPGQILKEDFIDVIAHADVSADDIGRLRRLSNAEYQQGFGDWDRELPYGYVP